jgi:hypothetical protein
MNNTSCEYCGEALPLGVDKRTRRIRTAHFASCAMRPKRVEVETPRREWRGLATAEIDEISDRIERSNFFDIVIPFARAIEQALKEKNHE